MNIHIISLFPQMFDAVCEQGVVGRAVKQGKVNVTVTNPRDFTHDKHRTVDDRPYGGGPGMLMMTAPLTEAIRFAESSMAISDDTQPVYKVYLSPQGQRLDHQLVKKLAQKQNLLLLAGRYEGIDERVIESEIDLEVSLGDFVLSGGEIAAMAVMDSVVRTLPGVLGHQDSAEQDSFAEGLLDHPHYTRPEVYEGQQVPPILLTGDHEKIRRWRLKQSLGRTWLRRKDLLEHIDLNDEQKQLLQEFIEEYTAKS
ncbi:tRNA (guanosine(37)-N1)-methyltransferase TrmD [Kangiella sediminilitoris]|uniref:tRNA (guanine-N(1)-)-methyltransferase n=1 Tax=Kangiella sediminilitoris TaxID=1144748 RepID=A0A1B3BBV0_9GAMM|nr:tRNA (guanosine(37)-N1)-methyltransferase TrmD [Kangiella sediminilitoris]AOE50261.1 tRNA (guanine-N1)-methyltransferase [Kangiella sediminilitoris]